MKQQFLCNILHISEIVGGPTQTALSHFTLLPSLLLIDTIGAFPIFKFCGSYCIRYTGKLYLCYSNAVHDRDLKYEINESLYSVADVLQLSRWVAM